MWGLVLGDVAPPNKDPFRQPEVIWGTAGLVVALLVGAFVLHLLDRWRKKTAAGVTNPADELTDFRRMFEHGEITEEEYARLRTRVAQRVKATDAVAGAVTPSPNPAMLPPPPPPDTDNPSPSA
jgi:hypothetical protein